MIWQRSEIAKVHRCGKTESMPTSIGVWSTPVSTWTDPVDIPVVIFKQLPFISVYQDDFAMSWSEVNILQDAGLYYIAARMGGLR